MDAISTRPALMETAKRHRSLWDGFLHPKGRPRSPPSSLLSAVSPTSMPRTPSPSISSDISQSINMDVSPLPSPLLGPRLEIDQLAAPGAKTNTFFTSPWKSMVKGPPTPLLIEEKPVKSSDTFQSSPLKPKEPSAPVDIPHPEPRIVPSTPPRSQTLDFFNSPSKYIPSPPPSIRQFSPDEKLDLGPALRLRLARLSTGRTLHENGAMRLHEENQDADFHSRSSSSSTRGSTKQPRDFVYWTSESSDLSRSSSRSSVSGIRRDFAITPLDAAPTSSSYSPPNHPTSPLARLRQLDETLPPYSPSEMLTPRPGDLLVETPTQCTQNTHALVRRETLRNPDETKLQSGMTIGDEAPLLLLRLLGHGAFSSVWLARDIEDRLIPPGPRQRRRKSVSTARKRGDALPGLRPAPQTATRLGVLNELDGEGAIMPGILPEVGIRQTEPASKTGRLVAVKTLDRKLCDSNDRNRVAFVREVEVLRHISHPSIVSFLHSFSISTHHCLVLEHVGGGELFELINSDENYAKLTTPVIRRMWGELCRAVGWLHGVAIVHRDIKLENIILTVNPFTHSEPIDIGLLPQPLVKLTDFGLARFIDPNQPMLDTRCGSESYAAPEIVMGSSYDGRQTDAWACGVVLYALAVRVLPFDPKGVDDVQGSRRRYLVRIAKCEYSWPEEAKLATDDLKKVVARLLVRDPAKRAKVSELWDEEFMRGKGAPTPPWRVAARRNVKNGMYEDEESIPEEGAEGDEYEEAVLLDEHDINWIASQETL